MRTKLDRDANTLFHVKGVEEKKRISLINVFIFKLVFLFKRTIIKYSYVKREKSTREVGRFKRIRKKRAMIVLKAMILGDAFFFLIS